MEVCSAGGSIRGFTDEARGSRYLRSSKDIPSVGILSCAFRIFAHNFPLNSVAHQTKISQSPLPSPLPCSFERTLESLEDKPSTHSSIATAVWRSTAFIRVVFHPKVQPMPCGSTQDNAQLPCECYTPIYMVVMRPSELGASAAEIDLAFLIRTS